MIFSWTTGTWYPMTIALPRRIIHPSPSYLPYISKSLYQSRGMKLLAYVGHQGKHTPTNRHRPPCVFTAYQPMVGEGARNGNMISASSNCRWINHHSTWVQLHLFLFLWLNKKMLAYVKLVISRELLIVILVGDPHWYRYLRY